MTGLPPTSPEPLGLGLLADDLTGASDCGVQFARQGAAVLVPLSLERLPSLGAEPWDVVALNTDSRNLGPAAARARVEAGMAFLARHGLPLRYKKIDSTLRGNLLPELEAVLAGGGRAWFAPAFPLSGRTVEQGVLLVDGVPVHETAVGHDALAPVRESRLASLLGASSLLSPALLPLAMVAEGAEAVARHAAQAFAEGHNVLVCDAAAQAHLETLARALLPTLAETIVVGSAGMARELGRLLIQGRPSPALPPAREGPVLVVAGSRNPVTRAQVALLAGQPETVLHALPPGEVDGAWDDGRQRALAEGLAQTLAGAALGGATCLVLTLGEQEGGAESPEVFRERSRRLNGLLGATVAAILARLPLCGLALTGGDVAEAVLEALRVEAVRLGPEVLPGLPLGGLVGGAYTGLRLATKAGGFGPPEALRLAVTALRA